MTFKSIGISILLALCGFALQGEEKKVILKNGKTFLVRIGPDGSPLPIRSDKIEIQSAAPMVAPASDLTLPTMPPTKEACLYLIFGTLNAKGKFKVTVTSPMDESIQSVSEVTGPGQFYFQGLEASEFPTAWSWLREPGASWIPLSIRFDPEEGHRSFEFLQWISVSENAKQLLNTTIKSINTGK